MATKGQVDLLLKLDQAKTQFYHIKAVIISGMGFFTDAYDLFCISLVTKLLGRIYYQVEGSPKPGILPPNVAAAVNGVALCGTLAGQLFFGWLGDKIGRKRVYGITLMLMMISSIGSGLSFGSSPKTVMATLCFFRFWLGFGIGGDYPLSATIMAEYSNKKTRGAFIAAVFAMQGFGILAGGIVAMAVSAIFRAVYKAPAYSVDPIGSTVPQADYVWRIILMLGALPAVLTYYWRLKMPETPRYTALVAKNAEKASQDMSKVMGIEMQPQKEVGREKVINRSNSFGLLSMEFLRRHGLHLLGTASTWFLLDIAYYSQNLFQKDIFSAVGWLPKAHTMSALEELFKIARAQFFIALCGTVPGYWFTVFLIDYIGRFTIQLIGFFFMTVFITTFIVPAEIFPARFRSTCHGISAAAGKAGAIIGAFGFLYAAQNQDKSKVDPGYSTGIGMKNALIVLGTINVLGFLLTFLVPEPKGRSLEEISGENEEADQAHPTGVEAV
ncbi:unnamed protein product [Dovyalis caffra]|uniref:Major facilitator superfamily (MFS) profile domain-containing protein n=1 Tax=Dovyalis caffra TaxID=77055 RepID=A0AAV1S7Z5_9ROSI|nr:unnamed protein product [Dovyalis caffra]